MKYRSKSDYILLLSGGIFSVLFAISPFIYMVLTSVSVDPYFLHTDKHFQFTMVNFESILTGETSHFIRYLFNSIFVSGTSAFLSVGASSLAAFAVTRIGFRRKNLFMMGVLAVSLFPPISIISYLFRIFTLIGWINTYMALVVSYIAWTMPLSLWILVSYFSQIPLELDRAGLMDGCSRFQIFYKIILPLAMPGIVSTALLAFIFAFNEFLFALMFTTDYAARTIPVGLAFFEGLHGETPWGEIMAASVVATLPVVIITLFFQQRIIQGLTGGAVKE